MTRIRYLLAVVGCAVLAGCEPDPAQTENAVGPGLSGIRYLASGGDTDGFERAVAPVSYFSFPADHGAHSGFRTEWWKRFIIP